jgi:hypothetical protein
MGLYWGANGSISGLQKFRVSEFPMKLRDQLRAHKGTFSNWPPIWTTSRDPTDKPRGEIGTLKDVLINEHDNESLFIVIEYQGRRYMGAMGFDSAAFCRQIYTVLQSKIGLSIKEIGDIVLP